MHRVCRAIVGCFVYFGDYDGLDKTLFQSSGFGHSNKTSTSNRNFVYNRPYEIFISALAHLLVFQHFALCMIFAL